MVNVSAQHIISIDLDNTGIAKLSGDNNLIETTSNLTFKQGEIWSFSYSSPGNSLEVFLPAGAEVLDVSANHISVQDERIVLYSDSSIDVKYKINQVYNDYLPYLIPVILIIIILIVRFFYFHIFRKNKTTKKDKTESKSQDKLNILKKVLNEREKIIINNLKKSGKIKMSHLRKLTYIPKASFSRHIQELEKKGLINRSGEGKNKFVEIK